MKPFAVARSRLSRAQAHSKTLADIWNAIPAQDFFEIQVHCTREGIGSIRAIRVGLIPEVFSLVLGEMLYQLRSALDACIYQATVYATLQDPPVDENKLEFPITYDQTEFPRLAKRKMGLLPQKLQDAVERLQPYHPLTVPPEEIVKNMNRSLGILNDLARKDRHRRLHVVGSWPYEFNPQFTVLPAGVTIHDLKIMPPGLLGDDSLLATFRLENFEYGSQIMVNPYLRTQIGCNELPLPAHVSDTFDQRMAEMINTVNSIILAFEGYF